MAIQSAVVLTDAASTPVNRSFAPRGVDSKGVAWWVYLGTGVVAAYNKLSQYLADPTPQSDRTKVSYKLEIPVLETVSTTGTAAGYTAAPKVAYTLSFVGDFLLPTRCSLQERNDLLAMVRDLLGEAIVTAAVRDLERAW